MRKEAGAGVQVTTSEQVEQVLDMGTCIGLMRQALMALGTGQAKQMVRPVLPLHERNVLGMMPAFDSAAGVAGVKVLSVFPENYRLGVPSHQGLILVFETATGGIKAVVDAESITAIRSAAASAAATDTLARPDASRLAILGAGVQGRQHFRAIALVRKLSAVTVWDLDPDRAAAFAREASLETGLPVTACASATEATAQADIICTVTPSREPILNAADVKPGTHINAVGACTPDARELSGDLMAAGRLFVDWKPAALREAGDYLLALKEGAVTEQHILGEVGSVMASMLPGRTDPNDITIFEALGQATQDLIAANYVANALRPDKDSDKDSDKEKDSPA
jgi:ornithine cyclodeaminase